MMRMLLYQFNAIFHINPLFPAISNRFVARNLVTKRCVSAMCKDANEMRDLMDYLESLKNYEKLGVPKGAGTDSDNGFDLSSMRRLMHHLGNPQSNFKAVHVAGTKGKGSTAAFISNILRAGGYSVGSYTSPHILSIRERICVGRLGEPVCAETLNSFFCSIKPILDRAIEEDGRLSHFEVLTGLAFALFANENLDIAVIEAGLGGARDATNIIDSSGIAASVITTIGEEHMAALGGSLESIAMAKSGIIKHGRPVRWILLIVVLGGPFPSRIEKILHDKASSMSSPVISVSEAGVSTLHKGVTMSNGRLCQSCDIMIKIEKDVKLIMELRDINLCMLGHHQLQNAATAACVALCLCNQGWRLDDDAIRAGLETTCLLGRSQFLTSKETETIGLSGATILLDGAHTKESARALKDMIKTTFPEKRLACVVAMADDKDHLAFARELLSGRQPEAVVLTEVDIAGGKSRTTSPSLLTDSWIKASAELGINTTILRNGTEEHRESFKTGFKDTTLLLAAENSSESALTLADRILRQRTESGDGSGIVVVTGSLHIVSLVLASCLEG